MPEHAEQRPARPLPSIAGYSSSAGELGGEQDRRGFPPEEGEHGGTVAAVPVVPP